MPLTLSRFRAEGGTASVKSTEGRQDVGPLQADEEQSTHTPVTASQSEGALTGRGHALTRTVRLRNAAVAKRRAAMQAQQDAMRDEPSEVQAHDYLSRSVDKSAWLSSADFKLGGSSRGPGGPRTSADRPAWQKPPRRRKPSTAPHMLGQTGRVFGVSGSVPAPLRPSPAGGGVVRGGCGEAPPPRNSADPASSAFVALTLPARGGAGISSTTSVLTRGQASVVTSVHTAAYRGDDPLRERLGGRVLAGRDMRGAATHGFIRSDGSRDGVGKILHDSAMRALHGGTARELARLRTVPTTARR